MNFKRIYISFSLRILFLSLICLISCQSPGKSKIEFVNTSLDSTTQATKIFINDLTKKYKILQNQTVEIEGITYWEFENASVCAGEECFWLDLTEDLIINDSLLQIASGKEFILKGTIDITSKGHLSSFLATIKNIYYIKQK